jgi:hypothetical protein
MIGLNLGLFGDNINLGHVSVLICALIECALFEDKLEKSLVFFFFGRQ